MGREQRERGACFPKRVLEKTTSRIEEEAGARRTARWQTLHDSERHMLRVGRERKDGRGESSREENRPRASHLLMVGGKGETMTRRLWLRVLYLCPSTLLLAAALYASDEYR